MIKIGITYRLFFSILAATCLAILCMFLIMQWSINRGFLQYLNTMAHDNVESMTINLEQAYAEHGNWNFFRNDPSFWATRAMNKQSDNNTTGKNRKIQPPKIPLVILDAEGRPLFGDPAESGEINYRPINNNNKTVGYVGLLPPKQFLSPHQLQFLRHQKLALITAVFGLMLVVAIFSLPLARRLVRPIKTLALAIHELASGKYNVRVPVASSDELGRLARAFNSMAMTLEKNEKARRQWVADISHELRTPLAVLRGEIEALLEGIRHTTPEAIRSLHTEVIRLHRLVDDLHQLTLSDLGALTYRKEELDPADILKDSAQAHHAEFARKHLRFTTDIPEECKAYIFGDGERLQQLFSNLFDNSLKYTNTGGELEVRLRYDGKQVVIDFEDSAPGVPEDDMEKLFDRLYRVDASRNRTSGGSGLGLAICRNIVQAHDGIITAHPSSLGGILIRVVIPVTEGNL